MRAFPAEIRASSRKFSQLNGVSKRTTVAVQRLESGPLWPGYLADAIAAYKRFLRRPSRVLYLSHFEICPCCDPVEARDMIQRALDLLPRGTGRDLRRLVASLDAEFERRTLPDPRPPRVGESSAWWHYRLYELGG